MRLMSRASLVSFMSATILYVLPVSNFVYSFAPISLRREPFLQNFAFGIPQSTICHRDSVPETETKLAVISSGFNPDSVVAGLVSGVVEDVEVLWVPDVEVEAVDVVFAVAEVEVAVLTFSSLSIAPEVLEVEVVAPAVLDVDEEVPDVLVLEVLGEDVELDSDVEDVSDSELVVEVELWLFCAVS
jgi:hypothetical protein